MPTQHKRQKPSRCSCGRHRRHCSYRGCQCKQGCLEAGRRGQLGCNQMSDLGSSLQSHRCYFRRKDDQFDVPGTVDEMVEPARRILWELCLQMARCRTSEPMSTSSPKRHRRSELGITQARPRGPLTPVREDHRGSSSAMVGIKQLDLVD